MAGEFTKRVDNGQNIWTCVSCNLEIVSTPKPRGHVCIDQSRPSTPSMPNTSQFQFQRPPPGFSTPGQGAQAMAGHGVQEHGREMDALFRYQQFQAEQNQQMMIFFQQQNQEMMKLQQDQSSQKMNEMMDMLKIQKQRETKVKCPKWEKQENVKPFLSRLQRWNEIEKGKGKYLLLLESLQDSGRNKEKQRVELEVQNGMMDPEDENVINNVSTKLQKWFGKTRVDEASEAWDLFVDIKRAKDENIDAFLLRFETIESQMKSSAVDIPNTILALQLLKSIDVSSNQKQNILVHVDIDDPDTNYEKLKSSIRLLKGCLVEKTDDDDEVNYTGNNKFIRSRSKSKSNPRFEDRSFDRKDVGKDRTSSRERGRSRERRYSQERSPYRGRSFSQNGRGRSYSINREYGYNRKYSKDRY